MNKYQCSKCHKYYKYDIYDGYIDNLCQKCDSEIEYDYYDQPEYKELIMTYSDKVLGENK